MAGSEFIRGNRDGPGGTSATYTVCRVGVPRRRLVAEIRKDLHTKYHLVRVGGFSYPRNNPNSQAIDNVNAPGGSWRCPAQSADLTAEGKLKTAIECRWSGARKAEFIHGEKVTISPSMRTYTICRLGVPRQRLSHEIAAGLHPQYCLVRTPRGFIPCPTNAHAAEDWGCCMVAT
ncbi:MAG TPA: hypothetical protein VLF66_17355 [Thermoanaerobaculia bacterium]|nr:hypothetical protein [Thermoanaerobaculia bacterium]